MAQKAPEQPTQPITGDCSLVNDYDWDKRVAYAICLGESSNDYTKINWKDNHKSCIGSFGLMQIACIHGASPETTPEQNMAMAYDIYKSSGWSPWGAYTNGSYLKYL